MSGMPMPGGWTMSMAWMRMPGQTWLEFAASFLWMWIPMMVAMMLPSLIPMLRRYRRVIGAAQARRAALTAVVSAGYFFVWTLFGLAALPLGVGLAAIEMQQPALARAVPAAVGVVVLLSGAVQLSAWKARRLGCCREMPEDDCALSADARAAWRHGLHLGIRCSLCCANLMVILLVVGVMDVQAMAVVTAFITIERLAPSGARVAPAAGVIVSALGLVLIGRAAGWG